MGASGSKKTVETAMKHCTLWKADRSPACRAVMMALDAMNLSLNEVDVNMDKEQHKSSKLAMNSLQTLPILKDRQLILCDSHAINTYLVRRYCDSGRLLPKDPAGRSLIEQMLHYNSGVLYPKYRAAAYPILYDDCRYVMPQHVCEIESAYAELESMLVGRTWFGSCSWPMLSDICICATVSTLNVMVPIDKTRYPRLSSWLYRMSEEMFYLTANAKGLGEFSKIIDCGHVVEEEKDKDKENDGPRTSIKRRSFTKAQRSVVGVL
ncbi:glutathione S-transferase 1-like isoform X2 [Pectinophora gossypiella]|uniref:glutathione S-transferase 1-like isoform X2 n=1 Tax=Pectinophora gossypiella TaxID=13191 RepID=UPI00214E2126|nr:glutathione S-transferase 1-like isoform X2 [Pectinophora gossypiella]